MQSFRVFIFALFTFASVVLGEGRVISTGDHDNDGTASGRGADGFVDVRRPTSNFGQATTLPTRTEEGDCRVYMRFDLSAVKEKPITQAALGLTLVPPSPAGKQRWNVFGLNDGDRDELWVEGNGGRDDLPEHELTALNAPGVNPETGKLDAERVRFLGTLVVDNSKNHLLQGDAAVRFDAPGLLKFLNRDTNNLVTLIITPADNDPKVLGAIASRKDGQLSPPTLLLGFLADSCACQKPGYDILEYPPAPATRATQPAAARTWVVNQNHPGANDDNEGTEAGPLKTLARAAERAVGGDTVLVHGGTYRERIYLPRNGTKEKPIHFTAAAGEQVVLKGSDVWQATWKPATDHQGVFTARIPVGQREPFRTRTVRQNATWADSPTVGQVYLDGRGLTQVLSEKEVYANPGSWRVDAAGRELMVHFPGSPVEAPRGVIEYSARLRAFEMPAKGPAHIQFHGFIFEHYPPAESR